MPVLMLAVLNRLTNILQDLIVPANFAAPQWLKFAKEAAI